MENEQAQQEFAAKETRFSVERPIYEFHVTVPVTIVYRAQGGFTGNFDSQQLEEELIKDIKKRVVNGGKSRSLSGISEEYFINQDEIGIQNKFPLRFEQMRQGITIPLPNIKLIPYIKDAKSGLVDLSSMFKGDNVVTVKDGAIVLTEQSERILDVVLEKTLEQELESNLKLTSSYLDF